MKNTLLSHSQHIRAEERAAAGTTSTASAPITIGPVTMIALAPGEPFSDNPAEPSIFLSTLPYESPEEKPTSVPYYVPSESPISEPSIYLETSTYELTS